MMKLQVQFTKSNTRITVVTGGKNRNNEGGKTVKERIIEHFPECEHRSFEIVRGSPDHRNRADLKTLHREGKQQTQTTDMGSEFH